MSPKFFWVFGVEFGVMTLNHWHSGHSLTHNFLRRIPQINSQCTRELYNKSREILDGLVKEENQKIEIQLLCRPEVVRWDQSGHSVNYGSNLKGLKFITKLSLAT